ncbi:MAG: hypothetical protein CMK54_05900 [Proteobacteria bacterium]|nr:hypothetical protein [Pseudomonadota bacterium]
MIDTGNLRKLNLGCGFKKREGYLNVDSSSHCKPDMVLNVQKTPWPFENNAFDKVNMEHILEHMPSDSEYFFNFFLELYRVCSDKAEVFIECPYPFHRWQVADFTHQKPIHFEGIQMLDKNFCRTIIKENRTKTPLAIIYDIDFRIVRYERSIDPEAPHHIEQILGNYDPKKINSYARLFTNFISAQYFWLKVVK